MDEQESSFARARADLEMLLSAFEAETQIRNDDVHSSQTFPFQATFQLSPTASFVLEWREGYPTTVPLQVVSFRSSTSQEKLRLEAALMAFRQHAQECLELQMEAGLTCCSAALAAWNEYIDSNPHTTNNSIMDSQEDAPAEEQIRTELQKVTDYSYHWITGEPLLDRKSTFQAHLCVIQSDEDVQPALVQLLHSSTKLQRATHTMVGMGSYVGLLEVLLFACALLAQCVYILWFLCFFFSTLGESVRTVYGNTTMTMMARMRPDQDWHICCRSGMKTAFSLLCRDGLVGFI